MRRQGTSGMTLVWLGLVAGIVAGGAGAAKADFAFGEPTNLGPTVNSSYDDRSPSVSADGLSLYFHSSRPGGYGNDDVWVTTRPTTDDQWGTPANLGSTVNNADWEGSPDVSADGLSLYFDGGPRNHSGICVAERATIDQLWGAPVELGPNVNCAVWQWCPSISGDGLQLYFQSDVGSQGLGDIWSSIRPTQSDAWQPAVKLAPGVNTSYHEGGPEVSNDGLTMFFHSDRPGGYGGQDLYMTTRPTADSDWGTPANLGPGVNTGASESDACVSADGRMLYFCGYPGLGSGAVGRLDVWQVPIIPIVDLSGDGFVDIEDLRRMMDDWGTSASRCDIGPMPWGDGVVDDADLDVLMSYWEQAVEDPTLVAHWKLDEAEGVTACDSVAGCDGILEGEPVWQPAVGMVGGALQFDGIDDCVDTPLELNPNDGPFSVFAWVMGGVPGQVIVHQRGGANWLQVADNGGLATELSHPSMKGVLASELPITDGNWHRVGLTWDGLTRTLYVDDVNVAQDAQVSLTSQGSNLCIGACGPGNRFRAATFFCGLIDDVRIYNRAVQP